MSIGEWCDRHFKLLMTLGFAMLVAEALFFVFRPADHATDQGTVALAVCCGKCESCRVRLTTGQVVIVDDLVLEGDRVCKYSRHTNWELCDK